MPSVLQLTSCLPFLISKHGAKDLKPNARNPCSYSEFLFCFLNQGRFTWCHDSILVHILKQLKNAIGTNSNNIQIFSDMPGFTTTGGALPVNIIVSKLRPDIVIVKTKKKFVHLSELTVPFEHYIYKAHERKTHKYANLVLDISQNGYNCNLTYI